MFNAFVGGFGLATAFAMWGVYGRRSLLGWGNFISAIGNLLCAIY